jgi:hypothetical protein
MSEIDHGARARLDYIEKQLEALFPGRYVPFAVAGADGMPPGWSNLSARARRSRRSRNTAAPLAPGWRRRNWPSNPSGHEHRLSVGPGAWNEWPRNPIVSRMCATGTDLWRQKVFGGTAGCPGSTPARDRAQQAFATSL